MGAQVDAGAQIVDVCMDDGLIDGAEAMRINIYIPRFHFNTRSAHDQYGPKAGPSKRGGAVSPQD